MEQGLFEMLKYYSNYDQHSYLLFGELTIQLQTSYLLNGEVGLQFCWRHEARCILSDR